jgi:FdhE protein
MVKGKLENELEELKSAIVKYKHLLKGGEIDFDTTIKIEKTELEIINKLSGNKETIITLEKNDLEIAISKMKKIIHDIIRETARKLGEENVDPVLALEAFYIGDTSVPGFKAAFITVQAIARLKAKLFEKEYGNIENATPYCPVCGARSRTMVKDEQGYSMICPFCGYKWRVSKDKLVCPYCGNSDPMTIGVFTGKKSKRLGLAWCQRCGASWHVILDRKIRAPRLLLPLIGYGAEYYRPLIPKTASMGESFSKNLESAGLEPDEGETQ